MGRILTKGLQRVMSVKDVTGHVRSLGWSDGAGKRCADQEPADRHSADDLAVRMDAGQRITALHSSVPVASPAWPPQRALSCLGPTVAHHELPVA